MDNCDKQFEKINPKNANENLKIDISANKVVN